MICNLSLLPSMLRDCREGGTRPEQRTSSGPMCHSPFNTPGNKKSCLFFCLLEAGGGVQLFDGGSGIQVGLGGWGV